MGSLPLAREWLRAPVFDSVLKREKGLPILSCWCHLTDGLPSSSVHFKSAYQFCRTLHIGSDYKTRFKLMVSLFISRNFCNLSQFHTSASRYVKVRQGYQASRESFCIFSSRIIRTFCQSDGAALIFSPLFREAP